MMERTEMEDGNQRTAQKLSQERMFLDVLCRDYTSVYYLNLNEDEVEVLKIASTANAVHVVGTQLRQKRRY